MSLLSELIKESAAAGSTGAGSVANGRARLFGGGPEDQAAEDQRKTTMLRRIGYKIIGDATNLKGAKTNSNLRWREIAESAFEDDYDASDVISKLDAAEKKSKVDDDTVCFGMEDEDGTLVKVYVRADQSEDFEQALASMLGGADEDADEDNTHGEIAEVLYQLKDKFEIVDVDWGQIEGDEEEEQEVAGDGEGLEDGAEGGAGAEGEMPPTEGGEEGLGGAEGEMPPADAAPDAAGALQSVIDMMKSDAEAKKAEAEARKAEAEAKIGKHSVAAAEAKVKQEEEILDMETRDKAEKAGQKEAKTLAKLAKYRHEIRGNGDVPASPSGDDDSLDEPMPEENEEEQATDISKEQLADLIFKHLAAAN